MGTLYPARLGQSLQPHYHILYLHISYHILSYFITYHHMSLIFWSFHFITFISHHVLILSYHIISHHIISYHIITYFGTWWHHKPCNFTNKAYQSVARVHSTAKWRERADMDMINVWWFIYFDLPQCVTHNGVVRCVTLGIAKLPHTSTHQIQLRPKEVKTPDPVEACCARGFVCLEFETVGYNTLQNATT